MLKIPYVDRLLEVDIPARNLIFDLSPRDVPPVEDFDGTIRRALASPIGAPPLGDLVRTGQKVIVVSDDNTRTTPTKKIIPILLDELTCGGHSGSGHPDYHITGHPSTDDRGRD